MLEVGVVALGFAVGVLKLLAEMAAAGFTALKGVEAEQFAEFEKVGDAPEAAIRFVRNCLYAAGNNGSRALLPQVTALTQDADPVVADAARWAVGRLG